MDPVILNLSRDCLQIKAITAVTMWRSEPSEWLFPVLADFISNIDRAPHLFQKLGDIVDFVVDDDPGRFERVLLLDL